MPLSDAGNLRAAAAKIMALAGNKNMGAKTTKTTLHRFREQTWSFCFGPDSLAAAAQLRTALMEGIRQHHYAMSRRLDFGEPWGYCPPGSVLGYGACVLRPGIAAHTAV